MIGNRMSHDTSERFKQKLKEQIVFLQNSCCGSDDGNWSEAVRIAASVRVILHDSTHSISLLAHLRTKNINLFNTYFDPPQEDNNGYEVITLFAMGTINMGVGGKYGYGPILDDFKPCISHVLPYDVYYAKEHNHINTFII